MSDVRASCASPSRQNTTLPERLSRAPHFSLPPGGLSGKSILIFSVAACGERNSRASDQRVAGLRGARLRPARFCEPVFPAGARVKMILNRTGSPPAERATSYVEVARAARGGGDSRDPSGRGLLGFRQEKGRRQQGFGVEAANKQPTAAVRAPSGTRPPDGRRLARHREIKPRNSFVCPARDKYGIGLQPAELSNEVAGLRGARLRPDKGRSLPKVL